MKLKYLSILILPLLWGCSGSESTDTEPETESVDTVNVLTEIIDSDEKEELFDMSPKPETLDFDENSELRWPTLKYYKGTIGDDNISMILNGIGASKFCYGSYLYNFNGSSFELNASLFSNNDSIKIIRYKDDKIRETFIGGCDLDFTNINGIWVKENDTLTFELKEQVNTPIETQIFINFNNSGDFYNTTNGIALIPGYTDSELFNSFMHVTTMGSAYDFGEEWEDQTSQVFLEDSIIIYTETEIFNSVSTVFKEGHEPDGPEYDDPDGVEGMEYGSHGKIAVSVIKNGKVEEEEIEINLDFTVNTWAFKNYIILADTESEKRIVYKWNREKEIFELVNN